MQEVTHQITLIPAKPMDLMELDYIRKTNDGDQKVWKLRFGIPYYLKGKNGVIEMHSYTTTDCTNLKELGQCFKENRVFIEKPRVFTGNENYLISKTNI